MSVDRETIRLECLKLAYNIWPRESDKVIELASSYEKYVVGEEPKKRGRPFGAKKLDNSEPLAEPS